MTTNTNTNTNTIPYNVTTLNNLPTTSSKIRYLASFGMSRGDIARKLEIRYQHVRNVLLQNPKKESPKVVDKMVAGDL
jgi:orotate phosphoribosyltransferase-like protein